MKSKNNLIIDGNTVYEIDRNCETLTMNNTIDQNDINNEEKLEGQASKDNKNINWL